MSQIGGDRRPRPRRFPLHATYPHRRHRGHRGRGRLSRLRGQRRRPSNRPRGGHHGQCDGQGVLLRPSAATAPDTAASPSASTNKGRLKHDFKISNKKTRVLAKGKSQSITTSLRKGSYRYLCTVSGHASAGMKGSFRVT